MNILENVNSPEDVKRLTAHELDMLCGELREFLIKSVAETGGHLASNLGTVELIVAFHRAFDTSRDRLVFDVGHQSYVHKMLTGRLKDFVNLRQMGGLSGFPKPSESVHDAFIAGHASNSISVALGMAKARTLAGDDYKVAAIIGDGALTGGLAFEGLSCAGQSGEPLVVILNDNGMSINNNVGGVASMLSVLRAKPSYLKFKRRYRSSVGRIKPLYNLTHKIKEWIKRKIVSGDLFADLGFSYLGPVDGHDVHALEEILRWVREQDEPILLHVVTQKGCGYAPAETLPDAYHGVPRFDPDVGVQNGGECCFSEVFGDELTKLADKDKRIVAITAAMTKGTGLDDFAKAHPERLCDVGIAEGHAATMAAGLAKQGALPIFAVYSTFLQRSYDMLIHDVSLQKLHVVFAVDRAGLVGQDGETHNGVFDVSYLCSVPNMTVLCPSSFAELRSMLSMALFSADGPVALRYPRGGEGAYALDNSATPMAILREGEDVTIIAYGQMINEALSAAKLLENQGVSAQVLKLSVINPLPADTIISLLEKTKRLIISEDACEHGSVGQRILAETAQRGLCLHGARLLNLGNGIVEQGKIPELLTSYGLGASAMTSAALELAAIGASDEKD